MLATLNNRWQNKSAPTAAARLNCCATTGLAGSGCTQRCGRKYRILPSCLGTLSRFATGMCIPATPLYATHAPNTAGRFSSVCAARRGLATPSTTAQTTKVTATDLQNFLDYRRDCCASAGRLGPRHAGKSTFRVQSKYLCSETNNKETS